MNPSSNCHGLTGIRWGLLTGLLLVSVGCDRTPPSPTGPSNSSLTAAPNESGHAGGNSSPAAQANPVTAQSTMSGDTANANGKASAEAQTTPGEAEESSSSQPDRETQGASSPPLGLPPLGPPPLSPAERMRQFTSTAGPAEAPSRPRGLPSRASEITFDDLKFNIAVGQPFERTMLTPRVEELLGKKVRLAGYILPAFKQTGLKQFVFVRDNMQCCFGPGAALYDCIYVEMNQGKSTNFSIAPVYVEGTLSIQERRGLEGEFLAIYHLAAESAG